MKTKIKSIKKNLAAFIFASAAVLLLQSNAMAQCSANFSAIQDSVTSTLFYFFGSANQPGSVTYFWTFGDNTSSTLPDPQHQYNAYGAYNVCLTVTDGSCTATFCDSVLVSFINPCVANFTYQPNPANNYEIMFYNQSAWGNTSQWYFGDGGTSTQTNPSHIYTSAGTYTVCLTTTGGGCTGTFCDTIQVGANTGCNAYFTIYPDSNLAHTYNAINLCSGVQPVVCTWSWGDGNTSTGNSPTHTYAGPGMYTICVSMTDANGCTSTYCDSSYLLRMDATPITVNVLNGMNAVQEIASISNASLYPNPTNDEVTLKFNSTSSEAFISVFDFTGRLVNEFTVSSNGKYFQTKLEVSEWSNGIYLIKISSDGKSQMLKLQVNH